MKTSRWIALVVGLAVVAGIEIYVWTADTEPESSPSQFNPLEYFPHLQSGEIAPDFDVETPEGELERIAYSEAGHTLLFVLSATCGTCQENIPFWNRIAREVGDDVRIVGLLITSGEAYAYQAGQKLVGSGELQFPAFRFSDGKMEEQYKVAKVPQTLLIGSDGSVELCLMGGLSDESVNEILARLGSGEGEAS
jgi:hypothetical protein